MQRPRQPIPLPVSAGHRWPGRCTGPEATELSLASLLTGSPPCTDQSPTAPGLNNDRKPCPVRRTDRSSHTRPLSEESRSSVPVYRPAEDPAWPLSMLMDNRLSSLVNDPSFSGSILSYYSIIWHASVISWISPQTKRPLLKRSWLRKITEVAKTYDVYLSSIVQASQFLSQGIQCCLGAIRQVQLGQDVGDVRTHRSLAYHQDIGNLLVRQPLRHEP